MCPASLPHSVQSLLGAAGPVIPVELPSTQGFLGLTESSLGLPSSQEGERWNDSNPAGDQPSGTHKSAHGPFQCSGLATDPGASTVLSMQLFAILFQGTKILWF